MTIDCINNFYIRYDTKDMTFVQRYAVLPYRNDCCIIFNQRNSF